MEKADAAPPAPPAPPRPSRLARIGRLLRRIGLVLVAVVVGLLVGLSLIDFGPSLRSRAEREGSRLIARPLHIGRLSINLVRGRFTFDDLTIENLDPRATPFFHTRRLVVSMPWWTILLRREIFIESITLSDWQMRVETYAGGGHNFIKIPKPQPSDQPRRFTTTLQLVRAERGEFTYQDYGTPWSTVARNLDLTIAKLRGYRGEARFEGGTVQIQRYEPMWANMHCTFQIDGGLVKLDRIDLDTDGAVSAVTGVVDLGKWPEQTYKVKSRVNFPRMREIFFAGQRFSLSGDADFDGTFHLFKGGRELSGRFTSPEAGLNEWRFQNLAGAVRWLPDRLDVTDTTSGFYGGRLRLSYTMAPFGAPTPAIATLITAYDGVDLARLTDFLDRPVLRLAGVGSGRNVLEWPLGHFSEHRGEGEIAAVPPPGATLMTRSVGEAEIAAEDAYGPEMGPFNPQAQQQYLPVGGRVVYRYGPEWVDVAPSEVATPRTFVSFEGRTAYGQQSTFPFHVTSGDWQESDRVLVAIINAFGPSARPVPVGGHGEFDGVMTGAFTDPRVTGRFRGGSMRAFDVTWGQIAGDVTIFNSYADVKGAHVQAGDATMQIDGRFSLGYPRKDAGEELDARVQIQQWPVSALRHAFALDDYPIDGKLSGEFHVYDKYQQPQGFGRMTIEPMRAYGESFDTASGSLRFEGNGVRLDALEARKSGGTLTGAAFIGWDGTYSFDADGRKIPVEGIAALAFPQAPLSGMLNFSATGTGLFASPRYEVRARIDDLFLRDEGIGQVTGRLIVRDGVLTLDQVEAASPRLAISGRGRIAMTPEADGELLFRFQDTSLDPYLRAFRPQLSPFTTAVASGTLRIVGELRNVERLRGEADVEQLDLNLFDYRVRNDGDIRLSLEDQSMRIDRLRLVGEGTAVEMAGDVNLAARRVAVRALGDANLGILQGLLRDIRSSGAAELQADIRGTFDNPTVLGALIITNGRLRHFAFPHGMEQINGRLDFDAAGLHVNNITGRIGGGEVTINGRLGFRGLTPTEYNLTATGQAMRLRYPEGFRSVVDADLALRGDFFSPLLSGTVNVRNATLERTFDTSGTGLFGFAAVGFPGRSAAAASTAPSRIPIRFDVRLLAPSTLRIENRAARVVSSAELTLRGTFDRPIVFGRVEIDRGEVLFEGNRYQVLRGTVDFVNPTRIEPFFDVEAETRAHVPGQVYRVVVRVTGTPDRAAFDLSSDPPLSNIEILSLLFGDVRDPQNADLAALRSPQQAEQELLRARAARLLTSPIASGVGRVVEEAIGVDTVQITPLLGDLSAQQSSRLTPAARLTVGKRISERLYITYSRALNASSRDEIVLVEYNQSDRLSWLVSQNEDRTYAVEFRVRHVF